MKNFTPCKIYASRGGLLVVPMNTGHWVSERQNQSFDISTVVALIDDYIIYL